MQTAKADGCWHLDRGNRYNSRRIPENEVSTLHKLSKIGHNSTSLLQNPTMSDTHPTILFYEANDYRFYGAGRVLLWLMQNVRHVQPLFMAPGQGELTRRVQAAGISTHVLPLPHPWQKVARWRGSKGRLGRGLLTPVLLAYTLQLMQVMRQQQVRGVHANSTRAALLVAPAARFLGLPMWWHVRRERRLGPSERLALALSDRVICVSDAVAARLGYPAKATVIHDSVPLGRLRPDADGLAFRQELGWGEDVLVVGAVASLAPNKRHDLFISMARQLAPAFPQARFLICGDQAAGAPPGYGRQLKSMATDLIDQGRLAMPGFVEDMASAYAAMDVLCFPSDVEGFGLVAIEAMMMGVPVVRTDTAGGRDMIVDGKQGFLIPVDDLEALSRRVAQLLEDAALRRRMGEAGRKRARRDFSAETMAARTEALFLERIKA